MLSTPFLTDLDSRAAIKRIALVTLWPTCRRQSDHGNYVRPRLHGPPSGRALYCRVRRQLFLPPLAFLQMRREYSGDTPSHMAGAATDSATKRIKETSAVGRFLS